MDKNVTLITIGRVEAVSRVLPKPRARTPGREKASPTRMPLRRKFTAAYKLQVLQEAERAVAEGRGALGAMLAREGLYSSHLAQWRKLRKQGLLKITRRGRPPLERRALLRENGRLKRKLAFLAESLRQSVLRVGPPGRGQALHAAWFLRQSMLNLADLAQTVRGAAALTGC